MKEYKAKKNYYNEVDTISGNCHYLIPKDSVWRETGTTAGFITLQNTTRFGDRIIVSTSTLKENFDII